MRIAAKLGEGKTRRMDALRTDLTAKLGSVIGATHAIASTTTRPSVRIKTTARVAQPRIAVAQPQSAQSLYCYGISRACATAQIGGLGDTGTPIRAFLLNDP